MKKSVKFLLLMSVLILAVVAFMVVVNSYFHSKEIRYASDKCYEVGGEPVVESSFLNLNYSFTCE